jgi:hypothetical protein
MNISGMIKNHYIKDKLFLSTSYVQLPQLLCSTPLSLSESSFSICAASLPMQAERNKCAIESVFFTTFALCPVPKYVTQIWWEVPWFNVNKVAWLNPKRKIRRDVNARGETAQQQEATRARVCSKLQRSSLAYTHWPHFRGGGGGDQALIREFWNGGVNIHTHRPAVINGVQAHKSYT